MGKPMQFEDWPVELERGYGPYHAVVERVVDGDTIHALFSLGLDDYSYRMVRIQGVNSPEIASRDPVEKAAGLAAKAFLESLLPHGTKCVITTDKDRTSFGRYVASIYIPGTDVATSLLQAGHATPA